MSSSPQIGSPMVVAGGWAGLVLASLRIFANADWVHKYHPPGLGWAGWAGLGRLPLQIGMGSDKTVQLG